MSNKRRGAGWKKARQDHKRVRRVSTRTQVNNELKRIRRRLERQAVTAQVVRVAKWAVLITALLFSTLAYLATKGIR